VTKVLSVGASEVKDSKDSIDSAVSEGVGEGLERLEKWEDSAENEPG
jgi:hypothetical protein